GIPALGEALHDVPEDWAASNLDEHLGDVFCVLAQTGASSATQDHCLHGAHTLSERAGLSGWRSHETRLGRLVNLAAYRLSKGMLNRVRDDSDTSPGQALIGAYLERVRAVLLEIRLSELEALLDSIQTPWDEDRTGFIIGNGGSAATASHMATDLGKQTQTHGRRPLRALSLSDNMALITAL